MSDIEQMDTETLIQATLARIRKRQGDAHDEANRQRLRAEFAEARVEELENDAQLDYDATKKVKAERDDLRAENKRLQNDAPRVIGRTGIKPEQIIAVWDNATRPDPTGGVHHVRKARHGLIASHLNLADGYDLDIRDEDEMTIVLLADAPEDADEEEPVTWTEEMRQSGISVTFQPKTGRPTGGCDCGCGATP